MPRPRNANDPRYIAMVDRVYAEMTISPQRRAATGWARLSVSQGPASARSSLMFPPTVVRFDGVVADEPFKGKADLPDIAESAADGSR